MLTARYLNATQSPVHIVWDPIDGTIVQMLSTATTAPYRGIPKECREGLISIMVTGKPDPPFTSQPCKGLGELMTWLKELGIPDIFPLGPQGLDPQEVGQEAGHYCRAGAIDIGRLFRSERGLPSRG